MALYGVFKDYVVWLSLKTLRSSSGIICWSRLSSLLPGELLMDKWESNIFFWIRRVGMVSHRSNKTIGSSLIIALWQKSFLAFSAAINRWHSTYTAVWHTCYCCMQAIARVQCAFLWLQYNTCNNDVLGSMWATCSNNIGHAILFSALAPRILQYSARIIIACKSRDTFLFLNVYTPVAALFT